MPQLLGLIFDLDGTLVDSAADLRQALNALLAAHGRRGLTLDEVKSLTGDGLQAMMQRAFAATGNYLDEEPFCVYQPQAKGLKEEKDATPAEAAH